MARLIVLLFLFTLPNIAWSRDLDGKYAAENPGLHAWFNGLKSGKGLCCSFADGVSISDVDWDTQGNSYRVRINGVWLIVPDNAVVTVPNIAGTAVVWPYQDTEGNTQIRCFMPGYSG